MNINDLNDDCLKDIFKYFDINQKLLLECVCLRWHQLIVQILNAQKVLKIGLKSSLRDYYNCNDICYKIHECPGLQQNNCWIHKQNLVNEDLCPVLIRCPNIQFLYMCDCTLTSSTLEWIVGQLKQIKCISLIAIQGLRDYEWDKVWTILGQRKLSHLILSDNHFANIDISNLIEKCPNLHELHLAYYRHPLTHLFSQLNQNLCKLSLIECFRTNLDAMKALVYGKAVRIQQVIVYGVPSYDQNILIEFICLKMPQLTQLLYAFDSPVPHIQPIEYLNELQHLGLLSNDEYGIDISSLLTKTLANVKYLQLNLHFDPYMLRNLDDIFPNVEDLEFSFDRICCNCEINSNLNPNPDNDNNLINNPNAIHANNGNNNNNNINNNLIDELNDDEPYMDDNCMICSEKCVLIMSKLVKLQSLVMNGERIKESALKAIQFCKLLNTITIDSNCQELNLKVLLNSCLSLAQNNVKQVIALKVNGKYLSQINAIQELPKNLRIISH